MQTTPIWKADLEKLAASDATDLAEVVASFVEQDDPTPDTPPREGVWSFSTFQQQLQRASYQRSKRRRSEAAREGWQRFLAQTDPPPPPRFALADMLVALYERRSEQTRASLLLLAKDAPLVTFSVRNGFHVATSATSGCRRGSGFDEARTNGDACQLDGAFASEFSVDATPVRFDGLVTDHHTRRRLFRGEPTCKESHGLKFARRE